MKIKVLDNSKNYQWVLAKVSLWDYLTCLTQDDFDYDIQRGIVINPYLDSILNSIVKNNALPPFSLVALDFEIHEDLAEIKHFNILDGLQRTYRLWLYKKIAELALNLKTKNYQNVTNKLKIQFPDFSKVLSPHQIRQLFEERTSNNTNDTINVWNLKNIYEEYYIYLYIWQNLTEQEAVKKMLILNAGQKRMPIAHQYELMYLQVFRDSQFNLKDICLYRTKENRANEIKNGNRKVGEYVIPSIIIGLQSFISGIPMRLSGDMLYSATSLDKEFITEDSADLFFNSEFIHKFVSVFYQLDKKISINNRAQKWMSKDATIAGLMGGFGSAVREHCPNDDSFVTQGFALFEKMINAINGNDPFQLDKYDKEYDRLQSAKINIGMILRKAIAHYTKKLISNKPTSWQESFAVAQNKKNYEE
jgi:hypothetical protein